MDARSRLIAPCWPNGGFEGTEKRSHVDMTAFVHRLLLFDEYILESHLLQEFHALVGTFGVGAVQDALESGALRVRAQALTVAQVAQSDLNGTGRARGLFAYKFAYVADADFKATFHNSLQTITTIHGIPYKEAKSLKKLIAHRRVLPDIETASEAVRRLGIDLDNNSTHLTSGIRAAAQELLNKQIPGDVEIQFSREDEFHVCKSNLDKLLDLSPLEHHGLIERGLLMCAGLEQRFQDLQSHNAVFGIRPEETAILDERVRALWKIVMPHEQQMSCVVDLHGLPDINVAARAGQVDLRKVLEIRRTDECLAFRQWLRDSSQLSDEDLREILNSVRGRIAVATHGRVGKAVRLAISTAVGAIPVAGPILGLALGAADTFLLEKILRKDSILHFIGVQYPSLFQGPKEKVRSTLAIAAHPSEVKHPKRD